jgi:hypothetical protein
MSASKIWSGKSVTVPTTGLREGVPIKEPDEGGGMKDEVEVEVEVEAGIPT